MKKIDEDFKEAKIYKELGDRLTGIWRFLIRLENEKQEAVSKKNYDEAEKIKVIQQHVFINKNN